MFEAVKNKNATTTESKIGGNFIIKLIAIGGLIYCLYLIITISNLNYRYIEDNKEINLKIIKLNNNLIEINNKLNNILLEHKTDFSDITKKYIFIENLINKKNEIKSNTINKNTEENLINKKNEIKSNTDETYNNLLMVLLEKHFNNSSYNIAVKSPEKEDNIDRVISFRAEVKVHDNTRWYINLYNNSELIYNSNYEGYNPLIFYGNSSVFNEIGCYPYWSMEFKKRIIFNSVSELYRIYNIVKSNSGINITIKEDNYGKSFIINDITESNKIEIRINNDMVEYVKTHNFKKGNKVIYFNNWKFKDIEYKFFMKR